MKKLKRKWISHAVIGLLLVGAGLSVCIDAAFLRFEKNASLNWFYYGTLGLIIFNSGLCFFGQAIIFKVQLISSN